MSGGIAIGFVEFADFCLNLIAFVALRLGRSWCETGVVTLAHADEPGLTSVRSPSQDAPHDDHQAERLYPLKAETEFDSPRERQ